MDGGAIRGWLTGAGLAAALGAAWGQMSAHEAQQKYEQSQREWRAQEQERINEQARQSNERLGRSSGESAKSGAEATGGFGAPPSFSQGGADAAAEIERTRRRLEREPALPPDRNPLLGQWRLEKAPARPKGGLGEMMAAITGGACQMLLGDGIWDFRPKSMHGIDRGVGETELDKVEYRGNARTVAVLPQRMFRLLVFEFESPGRIRFAGQDCVMVRVGGGGASRRRRDPRAASAR